MKIQVEKIAQEALRIAIKAIKFSKGGFDATEKKELADDLLTLAVMILQDIQD